MNKQRERVPEQELLSAELTSELLKAGAVYEQSTLVPVNFG